MLKFTSKEWALLNRFKKYYNLSIKDRNDIIENIQKSGIFPNPATLSYIFKEMQRLRIAEQDCKDIQDSPNTFTESPNDIVIDCEW